MLTELSAIKQITPAWGPRKQAALHGLLQWIGEAVIGLIPLIVFEAVHSFSRLPVTGICSLGSLDQAKNLYMACIPAPEGASQEICILAVVISGLAVLSVIPITSRQRPITVWTRPLVLVALISLVFGSLFYAMYSAHLDKSADTISSIVLVAALISSLFLAIEGAILEA
jgi:hypothetical protein